MTAMTPASPWSRMLPLPRQLWEHCITLKLDAGGSREVTLQTDQPLPENTVVSVFIGDANNIPPGPDTAGMHPLLHTPTGPGVNALSFSTTSPDHETATLAGR